MTDTVRKQKTGDQLTAGDWLTPDQLTSGPAEVLHALAYRPSFTFNDDPMHVHLVVREQGKAAPYGDTVSGSTLFDLATDAELDGYREAAERASRIADIRAYVDWLEKHPDQPVGYGIGGQVDMHGGGAEGVAKVRAFAEEFGVEVREDLDDRTSAYLTFGTVQHRVIAWHTLGRPAEPKPLVSDETIEQAGRMGSWNEAEERWDDPAAEHREARGWKSNDPVGGCGVECACGVTYDGFDTLAEASEFLARHIADPEGLAYSRADDDQETTQPVGRVPMHTGATVGPAASTELVTDEPATEVR